MADLPCRNENCKSFGHPHPNCRCYGGMAHGGSVESFCSQNNAHHIDCQYFASGGQVESDHENPSTTLGHAAVEHGLLGLLKNVGKPHMVDPEKHSRVLHEARNQHEWRRAPKEMKLPRTHGTRLGDHIADQDHEKAAEHMHAHPLVGNAGKTHLKPILKQMSGPLMTQDPHPEGFRGAVDYLSSAKKGHDKLDRYMENLLSGKSEKIESNHSVAALKEHLQEIAEHPESLLEAGGSLGHYLPDHSVQLSATAAQALNYLKSIKPDPSQGAPLDKVSTVSPADQMRYDRQLNIAQQPLLVLQHLKKGTLQPQDLTTVQTLYPGLHQSMVQKAGEQLIDLMARGKQLPYFQRQTMSLLLNQPLDSTMTSQSMQAIMKANSSQESQQQQKQPKKATGVELKQVDKMTKILGTSAQDREIEKRS
jgi:hypothetical protein